MPVTRTRTGAIARLFILAVLGFAVSGPAGTTAAQPTPTVMLTSASQESSASIQQQRCKFWLKRAEALPELELKLGKHAATDSYFVQGYLTVRENRELEDGRQLRIHLIAIPALSKTPKPDPIFILHGGPGAPATAHFPGQLSGWLRQNRDVILIDQRGTGSSNQLQVSMPGSNDDLQGYFRSYFDPKLYRKALPELQAKADLSLYTTNHAVDDFNQVREALSYQKINLRGGSYGSRAALIYMRRYPQTIRSATLQGIAPIAYRNPLPHARDSQKAMDLIYEEIRTTARYKKAFGDLESKFKQTLDRLEQQPATVMVTHPVDGTKHPITLTRSAFAEAVVLQLYSTAGNRQLPAMLLSAHAGDYRSLAESSMAFHRAVHGMIAFGMLFCVTASEDISRIRPQDVEAGCKNTFLGTTRLRERMAVAAIWPVVPEPPSFAEPVSVDVPVLLISGSHDPVTSPYWGEEAASHLPNSLHIVLPGGHGVTGPELHRIERAFLESASVKKLDVSAIKNLRMPPLVMPAAKHEADGNDASK
jgi:pimeloyl-ACP methyl ester carboxylesterase